TMPQLSQTGFGSTNIKNPPCEVATENGFITYSSDGTVRFWKINDENSIKSPQLDSAHDLGIQNLKNQQNNCVIFNVELSRVFYPDKTCKEAILNFGTNDDTDLQQN